MNFVKFEVTGVSRNGSRFKKMVFASFKAASMINLWSGSVWGITECGKRKLLKRVYN
jgi:hypothetical protein